MNLPPPSQLGICFHLAQTARLLFGLLLGSLLLFQTVGAGDTAPRERLRDRLQGQGAAQAIGLLRSEEAANLAAMVSEARWAQDFPVTAQFARQLGLGDATRLPQIADDLLALQRQASQGRPALAKVGFDANGRLRVRQSP